MTSLIRNVTVDCSDAYRVATFWSQVFDAPIDAEAAPGSSEVLVDLAGARSGGRNGGVRMLFQRVPEPRTVKNRLHLDIEPTDRTRDEEVARLLGLGAEQLADQRTPDGRGWVVLADVEGNEFCVERSAGERA